MGGKGTGAAPQPSGISFVATPVTAIVLCKNEERNLERTLRSVAGWCNDIHVVDSGSTDRTLEIARRFTGSIHHHQYFDHGSQWRWAIQSLPVANDWLLLLDADFEVSQELKGLIERAIQRRDAGSPDGYFVIHRQVFRGQQIRFGGTKKWWLRLVRRSKASIDSSEFVDFRVSTQGPVGKLRAPIYEHNRNEDDIDFWIDKHQKFAARTAVEEILRRRELLSWTLKPAFFGNADQRIVWLKLRWYRAPRYLRPVVYFLYRYVFRLGFLDGWQGFLFHFLQAYWFRLLVDIKIGEIENQLACGEATLESLLEGVRPKLRSENIGSDPIGVGAP